VRVGVDSGGTFTDVVALDDDGTLRLHKLPSQPASPAAPVAEALRVVAEMAGGARLTELVHSTTVATNALLERRGGPVALVTTSGFEDVIELGRQTRPRLYALHPTVTPPLVEAHHRLGIVERLGPDGGVVLALEKSALDDLCARLAALIASDGIRAIAICTLHAYVDGKHERAIADALRPLGLPLSLSSDVLPLMREYERTSTTVVDAYVKPVMAPYLDELSRAIVGARLRVMQSSGGALDAGEAARQPVRTILSGPAAGVIGAQAVARAAGLDAVITLDMGGTSADVALIAAGDLALTDEAELAGCALQLPMLAVHTVGAGGGSIARLDAAGALKVGPESAGAQPGPAAYDRGGALPTVTDANVVLGRLPEGLLGGAMPLSRARAVEALLPIAQQLQMSVERAAEDVLGVAAAVMARAIKVISVERGHDPAAFTLLPFGGAGALHACQVARELGMTRVLVPPSPGLICAYGALAADVRYDFVSTRLRRLGRLGPSLDGATLADEWLPLTQAAMQALDRDAVPPAARKLERWASLRYVGQSFELLVPARGDLVAAFSAAHRDRYGYALPDRDVELVTLRLRAVGRVPPPPVPREPLVAGAPELARVPLILDGVTHDAPLLARDRLRAGVTITGPALIAEYSATTLVGLDWRCAVLPSGALLLDH
jgi:N-methylhydantoinase A